MTQHRWTCLTTLVLATVLAPIATVHAKTLAAPARESTDNQSPLSSRSVPIVTPLAVTELPTDVAVSTVTRAVPSVSQLPIVKPLATATPTIAEKRQFSLQPKFPVADPYPAAISTAKFVATNISFNPKHKAIDPAVAETHTAEIAVAPLPQIAYSRELKAPVPNAVPRTSTFSSVIAHKMATPIAVVRNGGQHSADIINSATVQADIASTSKPVPSVPPFDIATERIGVAAIPQSAPMIATAEARSALPSFEAGSPVFVFDNDRPQQIVTTTIAQIGDTTVAPEPSIAIPVQRPKQSTVPTQSALPTQSAIPTQSELPTRSIVKIETPTETVRPILDNIVTTQIGKASWYGSEGGSRTANGERYDPNGLTAAHRTLPFGTKVRVTSLKTGRSAIVRINDRGPFNHRRIIDISAGTARAIGIKNDGIGDVRMEVLADEG